MKIDKSVSQVTARVLELMEQNDISTDDEILVFQVCIIYLQAQQDLLYELHNEGLL